MSKQSQLPNGTNFTRDGISGGVTTDDSSTVRDSATDIRDYGRFPVGLNNLGDTCYMNVLIQRSFVFHPFRKKLLKTDLQSYENLGEDLIRLSSYGATLSLHQGILKLNATRVAKGLHQLKDLFDAMIKTETKAVSPLGFINAFGLSHNHQESSHELWISIFKLYFEFIGVLSLTKFENNQIIEEEAAEINPPRKSIPKITPQYELSVLVSQRGKRTLEEGLSSQLPEVTKLLVSDGNGWDPDDSNEKVDAIKTTYINAQSLPNVLSIELNRHPQKGSNKSQKCFSFPLVSIFAQIFSYQSCF